MSLEIKGISTKQLDISKSKFICYIKNTKNISEFEEFLLEIKNKYKDARHICSAYIIGKNYEYKRANDGGEPSGTAGLPMLNILEKNNFTNISAIVVRYFGGIKLGAGGLIRAYSNSVKECLSFAKHYKPIIQIQYLIKLNFNFFSLENILRTTQVIKKVLYKERIYIYLLTDDLLKLKDILNTHTKGDYDLSEDIKYNEYIEVKKRDY